MMNNLLHFLSFCKALIVILKAGIAIRAIISLYKIVNSFFVARVVFVNLEVIFYFLPLAKTPLSLTRASAT